MRKKITGLVTLVILVLTLSACSKYENTGIGEVSVVRKGAGWMTEGGGIENKAYWAGTSYLAGPTVDVMSFRIPYTPSTIVLEKFSVNMPKMKNQRMTFNLFLTYMQVPTGIPDNFANFKQHEQELERVFRERAIKVLSNLDMGVDIENVGTDKKKAVSEFDDRRAVAKKIFEAFKTNFNERYPEYKKNFYFIGVAIGNVDFPPDVLKAYEGTVASMYETKVKEVEKTISDLKGQLDVKRSESDLSAFGIEAGAMDEEVMDYNSWELMSELIKDRNTDVTILMPVDDNGDFVWFKGDRGVRAKIN